MTWLRIQLRIPGKKEWKKFPSVNFYSDSLQLSTLKWIIHQRPPIHPIFPPPNSRFCFNLIGRCLWFGKFNDFIMMKWYIKHFLNKSQFNSLNLQVIDLLSFYALFDISHIFIFTFWIESIILCIHKYLGEEGDWYCKTIIHI